MVTEENSLLRNDMLLLLTAAIWGFAFTAQRAGMEFVGPFTYNGIRFFLGALTLLPMVVRERKREKSLGGAADRKEHGRLLLRYGLIVGGILFGGASLQQAGLVYTTAGKSGFITGLYVVIVPFIALATGQKTEGSRWAGVVLAAAGLYFLSITRDFTIELGDLLTLLGAVGWSFHVVALSKFSPRVSPVRLAFFQFLICSAASMATAFAVESVRLSSILSAGLPIVYGGVCSVGIGYTLQVVAQRRAHPAHAAIIMSMEGVFAVLGGFLLLHESLLPRGILGCGLMFTGMLLSQLRFGARRKKKRDKRSILSNGPLP